MVKKLFKLNEESLQTLSLRDFIIVPFTFYRITGIKLFKWHEEDKRTPCDKFVSVFVPFVFFINWLFKLSVVLFDTFEDTMKMSEYSLYLVFACNAFIKMLTVVYGRKKLHKVLKELEMIFPKSSEEQRDFRLAESYSYLNWNIKIIAISHCSTAIVFMVFPLAQSIFEYAAGGDFVKRTPYIMTYPFDFNTLPGYTIAYIGQLIAGGVVSCHFLGSDMMLICTILLVNMNFQYLCRRIENFKTKGFEKDMPELKRMFKLHNDLNDHAESVNNVFSNSILLNYVISILVLVLLGLQLFLGSEFLHLAKCFGFFISANIQFYYVCFFGTQLMENSTAVGQAFMGQEWYMADVRYQKMLVLAIARSQRPAYLTASKFFTISMETFSNFVTTSYQFFTLLKTRMDDLEEQ